LVAKEAAFSRCFTKFLLSEPASFLYRAHLVLCMDLTGQKSLDAIVRKGAWNLSRDPIIVPSLESEGDNIYAPCVLFEGGFYRMWYGGQAKDGHDRIHHATSKDGVNWLKQGVVIDNGASKHVNDPSVVKNKQGYFMYYSVALEKDDECCICLAHSSDGFKWQTVGKALDVSRDSWDSLEVARPSVIFEEGIFKLWYDCFDGKDKRAGYAVSKDGFNFRKIGPVLDHVGAVSVQHIGGKYLMLFESGEGTWVATSDNEVDFGNKHVLISRSGSEHDAFGHVTPFLFCNNQEIAIYMGMATIKQWCRNRIGRAVPR